LLDSFYPEYALDAAALLELCGYEVIVSPQQTCCAQPAYNSGYLNQALPVAKHTLSTYLADSLPVVIPSASCCDMIKHHYPKLLSDDPMQQQRASDLSERTHELIDFIVDRLPYDQAIKTNKTTVALHISCSARRGTESTQAWKDTLTRLPGVKVLEPEYASECCGFGGTFSVKASTISQAMTHDKYAHLSQLKAEHIVTAEPGCLLNLDAYQQKQFNGAHSAPSSLAQTLSIWHHTRFIADRFGIAHEQTP